MSRAPGKAFEGARERKKRSVRRLGLEADRKQREISVHSQGNA